MAYLLPPPSQALLSPVHAHAHPSPILFNPFISASPAHHHHPRSQILLPRMDSALHAPSVPPLRPVCASAEAGALARAEPVSTPEVEMILDSIKWDSKGLVVAIAQHVDTGAILMQGFANRDAVSATIASGRATFYSRSRSSLWTKGETSFNFINVMDIFLDCDRDSLIYLGNPEGPTCHTGAETCYFTPAFDIGKSIQTGEERSALTTLYALEDTIGKRRLEVLGTSHFSSSKPSWTKKLLKEHKLLCIKIREEADELCRTLERNEGKERTASEMADVLYHSMVLLAVQDVKFEDVVEILRSRFSQSGIEEKSGRNTESQVP